MSDTNRELIAKMRDRLAHGDNPVCRMIDNTGEQRYFSGQRLIEMVSAYVDAIDAAEQVEAAAHGAGRREFIYVKEVELRQACVTMSLVTEKEPRKKGGGPCAE